MKILVITPNQKIIELEVEPYDTIEIVKSKINKKEHYPINNQRLMLDGKQLEDNFTLKSYNIQHESKLEFF